MYIRITINILCIMIIIARILEDVVINIEQIEKCVHTGIAMKSSKSMGYHDILADESDRNYLII